MAPVGDIDGPPEGKRDERELDITYAHHGRVEELLDVVRYSLEAISLNFEHWASHTSAGPDSI